MDNEIKGTGNSANYKYRMHDPRLGRFFAVDPMTFTYPYNSPYAFSENRVIDAIELEGLEKYIVIKKTLENGDIEIKILYGKIVEDAVELDLVYKVDGKAGKRVVPEGWEVLVVTQNGDEAKKYTPQKVLSEQEQEIFETKKDEKRNDKTSPIYTFTGTDSKGTFSTRKSVYAKSARKEGLLTKYYEDEYTGLDLGDNGRTINLPTKADGLHVDFDWDGDDLVPLDIQVRFGWAYSLSLKEGNDYIIVSNVTKSDFKRITQELINFGVKVPIKRKRFGSRKDGPKISTGKAKYRKITKFKVRRGKK